MTNSGATLDAELIDSFESYFRSFVERAARDNPVYGQIAHHFGYAGEGIPRRGKRLRPRLTLAATIACGGDPGAALPACTAVELLHNYSLIHDDIEDGDRVRHGRETVWAVYGLGHGVNAGDAVGALAQLALGPVAASLGAEAAFAMSADLAAANLRMCEGQSLDLAFESGEHAPVEAYLDMIAGKTAALFSCSASLGARSARAEARDVERCADVGRLYGLAFQIQDDAIGIWGDAHLTGKLQSDLTRRKKSFPVVWAMERDPRGAGAALRDAYAKSGTASLDPAVVNNLRNALEEAGAREATASAAADYLARARSRAAGLLPLESFIESWSRDHH